MEPNKRVKKNESINNSSGNEEIDMDTKESMTNETLLYRFLLANPLSPAKESAIKRDSGQRK